MDFGSLPEWMQDLWPWMVWIGGVAGALAILVSLVFDAMKRVRRFVANDKSALDD